MITFGELVDRARSLVTDGTRALLGITGPPGTGKTTLAEHLIQMLAPTPPPLIPDQWIAHVPMDGFHLADNELARLGRLTRKGAPDTFDPAGLRSTLELPSSTPGLPGARPAALVSSSAHGERQGLGLEPKS